MGNLEEKAQTEGDEPICELTAPSVRPANQGGEYFMLQKDYRRDKLLLVASDDTL